MAGQGVSETRAHVPLLGRVQGAGSIANPVSSRAGRFRVARRKAEKRGCGPEGRVWGRFMHGMEG